MTETRLPFCSVEEAAEEIRQGRMIVLVDDEDRENEGDLTMAAEKITPEAINFMAKYGRGLICLTLTEQRCEELNLPLMSPINTSLHRTAFCEAIDARVGVTTGISASDRAITILTAIDSENSASGPGATRTHVPVARAQWRRACTRWADRGFRGLVAHRGSESFRRNLRNHE